MRNTRVIKFRRYRREKIRTLFMMGVVFPSMSILLGYLIYVLIILPSIRK